MIVQLVFLGIKQATITSQFKVRPNCWGLPLRVNSQSLPLGIASMIYSYG